MLLVDWVNPQSFERVSRVGKTTYAKVFAILPRGCTRACASIPILLSLFAGVTKGGLGSNLILGGLARIRSPLGAKLEI
jgi:hypothetical protein